MNTGSIADREPAGGGLPLDLLAVIQELSGLHDLESVTRTVARAARLLMGADGASFVLREGALVYYVDEDAIGPLWKGRRFPAEMCISGWAILHRRHAIIPDIYADPRIPADAYRPTFVKSLTVVPIRERDPLGAIGVYWASAHEATPHEVARLQALANATAVAIANVELVGTLMRASRAAEQARELAEAEGQRLQLALAAAEIGIWDHDFEKDEVHGDLHCRELFGAPAETGLSFAGMLDRIAAGDRPKLQAALRSASDPSSDGCFDVEYRTLGLDDGQPRWVRATGRAVRRDGRTMGVTGTLQDVTLRHQIDEERAQMLAREQAARAEAEAASRVREEFLAMLGHELRNPLAPIVMALRILRERGAGAEREHGIIERQVKHMVRLVDDLLDVSRVTQGRIALHREPLDMAAVIDRAIEEVSPMLEARRQHLERRVIAELPVSGDSDRLVQVVANLLTNAAKYTPEGGHIRISVARDAGEVVLRVEDDGIGIPPALLPRIFDLFVQARQSSDRAGGGLGLGLALVRSIVALHGGSVAAHSAGRGCGSEFVVRLGLLPEAIGRTTATAAAASMPPAHARKLLIVDDNADAAEMLADFLSAVGWVVQTACDGPEALTLLERFVPEVALLDIGLPIMDGYELATKMRERLGARTPRMIAITGYGQDSDRARSRARGFDMHLVKPVDPTMLLGVLRDA